MKKVNNRRYKKYPFHTRNTLANVIPDACVVVTEADLALIEKNMMAASGGFRISQDDRGEHTWACVRAGTSDCICKTKGTT
jgi:hypothetical protein